MLGASLFAMSDPKAEVRMSVDGTAAGGRIPLSPHSPVHPVVSHLSDGGIAVQEKCPSCGRWRIYFAAPADACCDNDLPAFVGTHAHNLADDYPDHDAVATINARAHHDGPLLTTAPARTAAGGPDPVDLL